MLKRLWAGIGVSACLLYLGCGSVPLAEAGIPVISQVIPDAVTAGASNTTLQIVGANITDQTVVLWNGTQLPTTMVDNTTVASPVESASLAVPGTVELQLLNSITGKTSQSVEFKIGSGPNKASALVIATTSLPNAAVGTPYSATLAATGGTPDYTWTLSSGKIPTGLALASNGTISGTPTAAGTFSLGLTVSDKSHPGQEKFIALTLIVSTSPLNLATVGLPPATYGAAYTQALQATGGTPTYNWAISSGSLPSGLSLTSLGVISGTPTAAGTFPFSVTVADKSIPVQTRTAAFSITVGKTALSINSTALPSGTTGSAYSQTLSASGGTPSYTWSILSGSLPAGLTLSSTGAISGTPTTSGTFAFGIAVSDKSNPVQTLTASLSITIAAVPLKVNTAALIGGMINTAYSQSLSASGGTPSYTWTVSSGSLPAGLTLASSGAISGTPSATGTFGFTATVSDKGSPVQTQSVNLSIAVSSTPIAIMASTLAPAAYGRSYAQSLQATGGTPTYKWAIASGQLPSGLSLATTGAISGTPMTSGTSTFTASVSDSSNPTESVSAPMAITVAPGPLTITGSTLPTVNVGNAYSQVLQASGGTAPYTWSITSGQLPSGLSLSPSTGAISGTPTASGTANFTATVMDSSSPAQAASVAMSLVVAPRSNLAPPSPLSILAPNSTTGAIGSAYSMTLAATGGTGPYSWSIASGHVPVGLSLSASTGVISGTPSAGTGGTYSLTVSVADSESPPQTASASISISIPVGSTPLTITSSSLLAGTAGTAYSQVLQATGGTPAYTWSIGSGSLPAGLSLAATTGIISGTPSTAGTSTFTATVTDNGSPAQTQSAATSITVTAAQISPAGGNVWFVRADGGTLYTVNNSSGQCDGQADAAYPSSGTNRHCAVANLQYLYPGGTAWVISGGDTVVVRGCAALPGEQNPSAPDCRVGPKDNTGSCAGLCYAPPPPSGTSTKHTVIEGGCAYDGNCNPVLSYPYTSNNLAQIFGGFSVAYTLSLAGSQYIDIAGLEFTTHNGACTHYGSPAYPASCSSSVPLSDYGSTGLLSDNTSSHITLTDVYFHGYSASGIQGPIGGPWTLNRVIFAFNAFSGWNFGDNVDTPDAAGSSITQSHVIMFGNGFVEQYPIVNTAFPALAGYDTNNGGFGDSWSGQDTNLDSFSCDQCLVAYNTKDGMIGPHTLIKNLSLTRSQWYGNMGSQTKWGTQVGGSLLFQNNYVNANCYALSVQVPGAAQNFNITTGLPGAYLSNWCRAAGSPFALAVAGSSTFLFDGNTIVSSIANTTLQLSCVTAGTCSTTTLQFTDNIFLGYTPPSGYGPFGGGATPAIYYTNDSPATDMVVRSDHNLFYGNRNDDCTGGYGGITLTSTNKLCADPQFVNEPAQGAYPSESVFFNFDFHPTAGSPVIDAGTTVVGLTTDYYGIARSVPPTIGAVEP